MSTSKAYAALAVEGPNASALGSAFISLVEPHAGYERAYNRWYEDDHYYSPGAMAMPWWFAGRRWVATRDLQDLRYPESSPVAQPITAGCYLATYWTTAGHWEDQWDWLGAAVARLTSEDRMFAQRTHVHTAFYDVLGCVRRDLDGPRDVQALDHPYDGVVLEIVDALDTVPRAELEEWLMTEYMPAAVTGSEIGMCLMFAPHPWPAGELWFDHSKETEGRIALVWFTDVDPRACWDVAFKDRGQALEQSGLARMRFIAPFIPTIPGTDRYVDELR